MIVRLMVLLGSFIQKVHVITWAHPGLLTTDINGPKAMHQRYHSIHTADIVVKK